MCWTIACLARKVQVIATSIKSRDNPWQALLRFLLFTSFIFDPRIGWTIGFAARLIALKESRES